MKNILLLGGTGKLGQVLTKTLLEKNYRVRLMVRNPQKINFKNSNLDVLIGNVVDKNDLEKSLNDIDVVITVLGHGFRSKYPIQKSALSILIPLMEKNKIVRFITVTGSGLITPEDKKSFLRNIEQKLFSSIDPYRMLDARDQQNLLENSTLDWTVIRTPIHSNSDDITINSRGYKKPYLWNKVSREAISNFIIECIEKDLWVKKSPVIY